MIDNKNSKLTDEQLDAVAGGFSNDDAYERLSPEQESVLMEGKCPLCGSPAKLYSSACDCSKNPSHFFKNLGDGWYLEKM